MFKIERNLVVKRGLHKYMQKNNLLAAIFAFGKVCLPLKRNKICSTVSSKYVTLVLITNEDNIVVFPQAANV